MKNTMKCFGIIALALTIGFSFVGCDNGSGGGVLAAPTGLTATPVSSTEINIFWNAVPGAAGYNVYGSLNGSAGFQLLGNRPTNSASHSEIQPGTTYYYRVAAYSANGTEGAMSNTVLATTPSGSSGGPRLTISNISTQAIHYVFISLSPTDVGNDWLGTEVINAGASRTFQLSSTGTYHISVVGSNTSQVAVKVYYPITGNQTLYFIGFGSELGTTNTPTPSLSLDGVWVSKSGEDNNTEVTVNGNSGSFTKYETTNSVWQDAINKGYVGVGKQRWRNLTNTGALTWSGQELGIYIKANAPNAAEGTEWGTAAFTLSDNGQTLTVVTTYSYGTGTTTWTRGGYSLDGVWVSKSGEDNNTEVTVNGNSGSFTKYETTNSVWQDAINKGYVGVGKQRWRNLTNTGALTWSGQELGIYIKANAPNAAEGTEWGTAAFTLSNNGQTLTVVTTYSYGTGTTTWTRK